MAESLTRLSHYPLPTTYHLYLPLTYYSGGVARHAGREAREERPRVRRLPLGCDPMCPACNPACPRCVATASFQAATLCAGVQPATLRVPGASPRRASTPLACCPRASHSRRPPPCREHGSVRPPKRSPSAAQAQPKRSPSAAQQEAGALAWAQLVSSVSQPGACPAAGSRLPLDRQLEAASGSAAG